MFLNYCDYGPVDVAFQDSRPLKPFIHQQLTLGSLEFAPDTWPGDLAHFDRQRGEPDLPNFKHIFIAAHREAHHVSPFTGYKKIIFSL
jgi:hypothetical protein